MSSGELEDGTWTDNLTYTMSFVFIWLLELTEADKARRPCFSNKNTLMVALGNIGTRCAVLQLTRVQQIVPVIWHGVAWRGHCLVLTSSYVLQLIQDLSVEELWQKKTKSYVIILRFLLT